MAVPWHCAQDEADDLRLHLDIVGESFNLLNRQNVNRVNPVYGSSLDPAPQFRTPLEESDAWRIRFSLDYEY